MELCVKMNHKEQNLKCLRYFNRRATKKVVLDETETKSSSKRKRFCCMEERMKLPKPEYAGRNEPRCPFCKEVCILVLIKSSRSYDCPGCGERISLGAINWCSPKKEEPVTWSVKELMESEKKNDNKN